MQPNFERTNNFISTFVRLGFPKERVLSYRLPELWREIARFRFGSEAKPELYGFALEELARGFSSVDGLHARMKAEAAFYRTLFKPDPNNRFKVSLKKVQVWPDGHVSKDVIVFQCPPGKEVGFTSFDSTRNTIEISFLQGHKSNNPRDASKFLGAPWFEVFMNRIIEAYKPLHKNRVAMRMFVPKGKGVADLPKKVLDRFFTGKKYSRWQKLNFNKKKVQKILRPR